MLTAILALVLSGPALSAQDGLTTRLFFNGFGTLGLVHSSEDQADFVESIARSEGPGYSRTVDAHFDTRLGGQVTLEVGSRWTGVALGSRWDVMPGVALKAQVDFINVLGDSFGPFTNLQPGFEPGSGTRPLSISTDFVF